MDRADKLKITVTISFRVLLVIAIAFSIIGKNWINVLISALTFFATFIPSIFEKRFEVDYPSEFEIIILIFIFASLFLGEITAFYVKFWWWDLLLHVFSGVIIAIFAFSLIYVLNGQKKIMVHLSPAFAVLFTFCFAMAIGSLWEILEFSIDTIFKMNMQKSGLIDTMTDMIVYTFGSLSVAVVGYLYLKFKSKMAILDRTLKKLFKQNKHLFND